MQRIETGSAREAVRTSPAGHAERLAMQRIETRKCATPTRTARSHAERLAMQRIETMTQLTSDNKHHRHAERLAMQRIETGTILIHLFQISTDSGHAERLAMQRIETRLYRRNFADIVLSR